MGDVAPPVHKLNHSVPFEVKLSANQDVTILAMVENIRPTGMCLRLTIDKFWKDISTIPGIIVGENGDGKWDFYEGNGQIYKS